MTLSDAELKRYSRQLVLDGIGPAGQQKLRGARVSVVGIGGLGCVSATQLAAMGVGYLRLIDQDVVDLTNLHRQFLYDTDSLGYPKVEIAQKRLEALNPHIEVEASPMTVTRETAADAVRGVDVVVDGLDHFAPRYALNEACVEQQIPYIYAGALGAYGNVSTLIPGVTPCLECLTGTMSDEGLPTCESVGVLPPRLSRHREHTGQRCAQSPPRQPALVGQQTPLHRSEHAKLRHVRDREIAELPDVWLPLNACDTSLNEGLQSSVGTNPS